MAAFTKQLLIWGAGGHAKVVADVARACGWEILGFLDENTERHHQPFYGAQILGGSSLLVLPSVDPGHSLFVAIGDNLARDRCLSTAIQSGYKIPVLIHPSAVVSPTAELEPGTVVMAGAIVQAETHIGLGGIINTGASVDHDGVLGRCVHVAPGARLTGQVRVGDHTLVGAGAVVIPRIAIGRHCIIGAGAAVIADVPEGQTVVGVPARVAPKSSVMNRNSSSD